MALSFKGPLKGPLEIAVEGTKKEHPGDPPNPRRETKEGKNSKVKSTNLVPIGIYSGPD